VALGLLLAGCRHEAPPPAPSVDETSHRVLPAGEVVGFSGTYGSHVWLGLPYAEPPTGDQRWRAPVSAKDWRGLRSALAFGSPCPQLATPFAGVIDQEPGTFAGDEDCLYLNVYAPRFPSQAAVPTGDERLPVMVWIHGGGNSVGLSNFYDGGKLARTENVVVVTINYRLGPLGWLRNAALRAGAHDDLDRSGNYGILDQIEALRWVRRNIAAFGGDPENVTIFGESAGARDVMALLVAPQAQGLFQRAIAESGSARNFWDDAAENWTDDTDVPGATNSSNEVLARLLITAGKVPDRAAAKVWIAKTPPAEIEAFWRATTPADLIRAYRSDAAESIPDVPNVFADGVVLPTEPLLARYAMPHGWNGVPVMFGSNKDENRTFMFADPKLVTRWFGVLPRLVDEESYDAMGVALADAWKVAGVDVPATAIASSGWRDVYAYRWDWDEEPSVLGSDLSVMIGAGHGFEIPFVFGHWDLGPRGNIVWTDENKPGREQLSREMMSYWAEFARTGRPGRGGGRDLPEWRPWDASRPTAPKFMVLDTDAGGGLRMSSDALTPESVIEAAVADPRITEGDVRCSVYRGLERSLAGVTDVLPDVAVACTAAVGAGPSD
jgi:para-nitrobenzyl esterase